MRIGLAQLHSTDDPGANLRTVAELTARAAEQGVELLVFPEATMCRFGVPLRPIAEPFDGPWAGAVRELAARHGLVVVAGMFTPAPDGRVHNTLLATGPGVEERYDKIYLFDAFGFRESATVAPGDRVVTIEVGGVMVGLTTCYDVRFPELYVALAERGARVITVSASWASGAGKLEHWSLLTRARALDTTTFVAAAGQADPATVGAPPEILAAPTGIGHSALIAPSGAVLAELGGEPGLLIHDLDLADIDRVRAGLPVLASRSRVVAPS
jgi:predicted amidohydrolase